MTESLLTEKEELSTNDQNHQVMLMAYTEECKKIAEKHDSPKEMQIALSITHRRYFPTKGNE